MPNQQDANGLLNRPLVLPCGAVLKNRLIKSAMSDSLGDGAGNATTAQARLYEKWAQGGTALSIIGEVQFDPRFPERPGNLVLCDDANLKALRELTSRASINQAHIWPQIGHAGGLSHPPISHPKGPSRLDIGEFHCDGMSQSEVAELPARYAKAAKIAQDAGFTGVQIHAGHGFLLSQFLSPLFNRRDDQYGGDVASRCRIVIDVIAAVRDAVGSAFPIGIKINTTDQLEGGLTQEDALAVIGLLDSTSLDLIELSGGSYFPGAASSSDRVASGPYFVEFAEKAKPLTRIPLVVTGGFKTRTQAVDTLAKNCADAIGLARALVLEPSLPQDWLADNDGNLTFPSFSSPPPGGITAWFSMRLTAIGNDEETRFNPELQTAIDEYEDRDDARCAVWRSRFGEAQ
ncbi:NADH:flavin oxidoreductase/NADH oxidase family protein [Enterovibrio calviensis]|uniref:NADH:flavin oxidoreductase/NADH oxidase family protein n=1 Tax=Enterovibrio calviensis TaxID=91359 RepID=UPI000482443C|nr:NADH:flavin oxidoreductase/NADH oxidase family protein [Enterovibrio calviensis]